MIRRRIDISNCHHLNQYHVLPDSDHIHHNGASVRPSRISLLIESPYCKALRSALSMQPPVHGPQVFNPRNGPQCSALGPRCSALGPRCFALGVWPSVFGPQCSALGVQPSALGVWPSVFGPRCSVLGVRPSVFLWPSLHGPCTRPSGQPSAWPSVQPKCELGHLIVTLGIISKLNDAKKDEIISSGGGGGWH